MIRDSRLLTALVLFPLCTQLILTTVATAQDEKAESDAAKAPALKVTVDADEKDPSEQWKSLLARRLSIFEKLQELKKKFEDAATSDEKRSVQISMLT